MPIFKIVRLRAFEVNGGIVYDLLLAKKITALNKARSLKMDQEILKKRNLVATDETLGILSFVFSCNIAVFKTKKHNDNMKKGILKYLFSYYRYNYPAFK